eukprot:maker-scaffold134_size322110-snap-gene-2.23 protein:Tk07181 transcript:maker-scaffold134_size322110-snap-gene-2.23-mRNA-1 annotation:"set domain-containing protein 5"
MVAEAKKLVSNLPFVFSLDHKCPPLTHPAKYFKIRDIPGKGQGMFATRFIASGEIILREKPLIVMPNAVFEYEDMRDIDDWLERSVNKLSCEERSSFLDLSDSRSQEKTYAGIFFTNDMNFKGDAAVFITMAKANHDCAPNADFMSRCDIGMPLGGSLGLFWSLIFSLGPIPDMQDLMAVRDILPGQEITLSYLPAADEGSDEKSVRQAYTREWYGFQCTCLTCCLQGDALNLNEAIRLKVKVIQRRDLSLVSLEELEEFLVNLEKIKSKLPYQLDMNRLVFDRALGEGNFKTVDKIGENGCKYFCLSCLCNCPMGVAARSLAREKYNIMDTYANDAIIATCCGPCSMCQIASEVQNNNY